MSFPDDPLTPDISPERIRALRAKIFDDMVVLSGAVYAPDDQDDREAVLMVCEALHHLCETFLELR